MADWQLTLDIQEEWRKHAEDKLTLVELAVAIAVKMRLLDMSHMPDWVAETRDSIAASFDELTEDSERGVEDFNGVMAELYDWGDESLVVGA